MPQTVAPSVRRRAIVPGMLIAFALTLAAAAWAPVASGAPAASAERASHSAAVPSGVSRWPGRVVTYSDASGHPREVHAAVRAWNRVTSGLRLVPARRGTRAQIRLLRGRPGICERTAAACGFYPPDGRVYMPPRRRDTDTYFIERLAIHEIGHALGLAHAGGCSIMHPYLDDHLCTRPPARFYRCGPQPGDARALVRLYGGRITTRGLCRHAPPPPARSALVAPTGTVVNDGLFPSSVIVVLRNRSRAIWGSTAQDPTRLADAKLLVLRTGGRPGNGCTGGPLYSASEPSVPPGGRASFYVPVCPPGAQPVTMTMRVRVVLENQGGRRVGPVHVVRMQFREPPAEPAFEQPLD